MLPNTPSQIGEIRHANVKYVGKTTQIHPKTTRLYIHFQIPKKTSMGWAEGSLVPCPIYPQFQCSYRAGRLARRSTDGILPLLYIGCTFSLSQVLEVSMRVI